MVCGLHGDEVQDRSVVAHGEVNGDGNYEV